MITSHIDHLVLTAPTLESGADVIKQTLGVNMQSGGEHPLMGTHNLLLSLGPTTYLEVIAVNPKAPAPGRPRWFGLDSITANSPPTLGAWVVRTSDIHASVIQSSQPLGAVEAMSRGALSWMITIPQDGRIPLEGVAPALIEWPSQIHPATNLSDRGCRLLALDIFHPDPEQVEQLLASLDLCDPINVTEAPRPCLQARINTPGGLRALLT